MGPESVRFLIVDDHDIWRRGVRAVLEREPAWTVCGEASTGHDAVELASKMRPDVVILDIGLPDMSGLEVLKQLRASVKAHVLILSVHDADDLRHEAMKSGGRGWVIKSEAATTLVDAVHDALGREAETVDDSSSRSSWAAPSTSARQGARELSLRERQVLRLLSEGKSNKEIGVALGIASKTVETHRTHITEKLRLRGLANLVRYAIRNRILEP